MTKQTTKAELEAENKRLLTTNDALYKLCVQNLSETGRLLKAYAKYNAKLRRLEQEESNFFSLELHRSLQHRSCYAFFNVVV